VRGVKDGQQRYALLLNPEGGIKDDFMVARLDGESSLHCGEWRDQGRRFCLYRRAAEGPGNLTPHADRALLALQGPASEKVLSRHAPAAKDMTFMKVARMDVAGAPAIVSRSGYTGEDGFEISIAAGDAERVARTLLNEPEALPIGLGARDSLRLEAGLCLYGHDLNEDIDPVSANLVWSIGKRRKADRDFPAAEKILKLLSDGPREKRIGIRPEGRAPAREGAAIADKTGRIIGRVTSGGFGPSAMRRWPWVTSRRRSRRTARRSTWSCAGTAPGAVAPMPFVPHRYKRAETVSKAG